MPAFYLKGLAQLEDFTNELHADKDIKKKMNPSNAKSLTATRQKVRKNNKTIENELNAWRAVHFFSLSLCASLDPISRCDMAGRTRSSRKTKRQQTPLRASRKARNGR